MPSLVDQLIKRNNTIAMVLAVYALRRPSQHVGFRPEVDIERLLTA